MNGDAKFRSYLLSKSCRLTPVKYEATRRTRTLHLKYYKYESLTSVILQLLSKCTCVQSVHPKYYSPTWSSRHVRFTLVHKNSMHKTYTSYPTLKRTPSASTVIIWNKSYCVTIQHELTYNYSFITYKCYNKNKYLWMSTFINL